ncbi:MAG: hypothetical protein ABR936_06185 [Bacteroidota bacterium]
MAVEYRIYALSIQPQQVNVFEAQLIPSLVMLRLQVQIVCSAKYPKPRIP